MGTYLNRNRESYQSTIPQVNMRRSIFPAEWSRKQTFNASEITPIMCKRVVPTQSMFIDLTSFIRLTTQLTCPIDNLYVETFFFYVPDRLVWENAEKFIGAKDPEDTTTYLIPQIEIPAEKNTAGSLFNLLSASRIGKKVKVSKLPFEMHNLIYNEWFRDSDCQVKKPIDKTDADGNIDNYGIYRIHKSRDYFTNSTRDRIKGDPVNVPLGTAAPVVGNGMTLGLTDGTNNVGLTMNNTTVSAVMFNQSGVYGQPVGTAESGTRGNTEVSYGVTTDPSSSGLTALLNQAVGADLEALRQAIFTYEYKEALNRSGSKYADIMENIYGCTIPDLRISRPEYLGGYASPMFTNPVVQTSGSTISGSDTPQGNIAGYGTHSDGGSVIDASFLEFGYVIGYVVIKALPQYQQGLDKHWVEKDFLDLFNPFFNNAGDQAIRMEEIYQYDYDEEDEMGNLKNDKIFGYNARNENMRTFKNEIAGELNSEYEYPLDIWHYAEKFENEPNNNADFMEDKTQEILDRTLAIKYEDEKNTIRSPQFIGDFVFDGAVSLPIPVLPVPKMVTSVY